MELGLGLYRFREDAKTLLETYMQRGGKIFDAAPNYAKGGAHALIANRLQARNSSGNLLVWSKVGFQSSAAVLEKKISTGIILRSELVDNHAINPILIRSQLVETLAELNGTQLDALYLHNPERQLLRLSERQFWDLMTECVHELELACTNGFIRRWGISVWDGFDRKADNHSLFSISDWENVAVNVAGKAHHFSLVQLPLNLSRFSLIADSINGDSGVIRESVALGKSIVSSSPMQGGALPPVLNKEFTELFGDSVTPGQACLLFLASIQCVSVCLISPRTVAQLNDSLEALQLPCLNRESLCRLVDSLVK